MNLSRAIITLTEPSLLVLVYILILGAAFGSFANVVIWRLPRGQSLVLPGSRCPVCGTPIPLWRNIPVLSFILQCGKAACCGSSISVRYPIIEALCALLASLLYLKEGLTVGFLFETTWIFLLVILAAIDLEHFRLPNVLVGFGAALSLLWMIVAPPQTWIQSGAGLLTGIFFALGMMLVGKMVSGNLSGFGDLKLTLVLGFTFGAGRFVILFFCATISAMLYGLYRRRKTEEKRIPLGPFFALGVWVVLWCGTDLLKWYFGLLHP